MKTSWGLVCDKSTRGLGSWPNSGLRVHFHTLRVFPASRPPAPNPDGLFQMLVEMRQGRNPFLYYYFKMRDWLCASLWTVLPLIAGENSGKGRGQSTRMTLLESTLQQLYALLKRVRNRKELKPRGGRGWEPAALRDLVPSCTGGTLGHQGRQELALGFAGKANIVHIAVFLWAS